MVRRITATTCLLLLLVGALQAPVRVVPLLKPSISIPEEVVLPEDPAPERRPDATAAEARERPQRTEFIRSDYAPPEELGGADASNDRVTSGHASSRLVPGIVFETADDRVFSDQGEFPWRSSGETGYMRPPRPVSVPDGGSPGLLILLVAAIGAIIGPLRNLVHCGR